ncbi:MAG TPA: nickel insertion protein, partial [Deferrisomatales bacterium]|nr:nickel insertion protein [Deferrisomatales bacterium]
DPGYGPRLEDTGGTALSGTEALSQLAAAGLPLALRARAEAALIAHVDITVPRASLPATEFGLALAVSAAVEALGPTTLSTSPLPLPCPTPSGRHEHLLARLRGALVRVTDLPPEAVTPLGVALVRSLAEPAATPPDLELTGHGTGRDAGGTPRVRVLAGRRVPGCREGERLVLLETNLDDLQPEIVATLIPSCLAAGAVDAWLTPVLMKKGRPAQVLSALCMPGGWVGVEQLLFRESSTLGVRRTEIGRTVLSRHLHRVNTPWGPVTVKLGLAAGVPVNCAPEFEDCRRLAEAAGVPVKRVYAAALAAVADGPMGPGN